MGFPADFYIHNFTKRPERKFLNLAHYFQYDLNSDYWLIVGVFLANQIARNAIVGAENLLNRDSVPLRKEKF